MYSVWCTVYKLCQVVAVVLEATGVGAPVAVHLDKELEEDLFLKEVLYVFAGLGADTLEGCAGFADKNALLGITLAVDDGGDLDQRAYPCPSL